MVIINMINGSNERVRPSTAPSLLLHHRRTAERHHLIFQHDVLPSDADNVTLFHHH
jgi:hypothetical protein